MLILRLLSRQQTQTKIISCSLKKMILGTQTHQKMHGLLWCSRVPAPRRRWDFWVPRSPALTVDKKGMFAEYFFLRERRIHDMAQAKNAWKDAPVPDVGYVILL